MSGDEVIDRKERKIRVSGTGHVIGIPESWVTLLSWLTEGKVVVELTRRKITITAGEDAEVDET